VKTKPSLALATALVQAWRADAILGRLSDELLEELKAIMFLPYDTRVQVLLAQWARLTSSALWDGASDQKVIATFMRYGFDLKQSSRAFGSKKDFGTPLIKSEWAHKRAFGPHKKDKTA
jgi:hypothetical protein